MPSFLLPPHSLNGDLVSSRSFQVSAQLLGRQAKSICRSYMPMQGTVVDQEIGNIRNQLPTVRNSTWYGSQRDVGGAADGGGVLRHLLGDHAMG